MYISHRLSSTQFTDKIAVFSDGELCEYGDHKELMDIDGGLYRKSHDYITYGQVFTLYI